MKIEIIIVYMQRYKNGHEANFVPPITGIYLAALTPAKYEVKVLHQQIEEVDIDTTADVIALSFFSGFAPEAYSLARRFKDKGKIVIAGGPHVTYYSDEALNYVDAIITGEVENIWEELLHDADQGVLKKIYSGQTPTLETAPTPRYDLLPDAFFVKKVVQATRGCFFNCSFCTVPTLNPGYRKRPVDAVLQDIQYDKFSRWWQNKVVWFWDDNLTADRQYAKELLRKMIPLKKWWLTQASIDIANDEELLDLMKASGCIGVFFGIESFDGDSLNDANKGQNKIEKYKNAVDALRSRGISVMAGLISGFDHDTPDSILKWQIIFPK
ncbi:B12-binding domain-containing radical SAM protein [Sporomusa malonica]|uniref:B12 binding domain-containing protein n=1 Tax=Sporomusa malonica TaxID=112901 RepID=A0A1W1ZBG1_9FIRM|nr:radical SAM protein [Sporomusa malonica]SMC45750.1 B12 binding domain-containing protein [Sporomusa malonica]